MKLSELIEEAQRFMDEVWSGQRVAEVRFTAGQEWPQIVTTEGQLFDWTTFREMEEV